MVKFKLVLRTTQAVKSFQDFHKKAKKKCHELGNKKKNEKEIGAKTFAC